MGFPEENMVTLDCEIANDRSAVDSFKKSNPPEKIGEALNF